MAFSFLANAKVRGVTLLLAPTVLALVAVLTINSHYIDLFGAPYQKKTEFLNKSISSCLNSGSVNSVLILPPKLPFPSFQRLGVFSMSTDLASEWVPKPNAELLLQHGARIDIFAAAMLGMTDVVEAFVKA